MNNGGWGCRVPALSYHSSRCELGRAVQAGIITFNLQRSKLKSKEISDLEYSRTGRSNFKCRLESGELCGQLLQARKGRERSP